MKIKKNPVEALRRLGLIEGEALDYLRSAPLGDPILFRFRGSVIAIRKKDLNLMELEDE